MNGTDDGIYDFWVSIYKNGSAALDYTFDGYAQLDRKNQNVAGILDMDADDYIELYAKSDVASGTVIFDGSSRLETHFGGFKIGT